MLLTLKEIQSDVDKMIKRIGYPIYSINLHDERPLSDTIHIIIENNQYHYAISERGYFFGKKSFDSIDELMFHIMSEFSFSVANKYQQKNPVPGADPKRLIFAWYSIMMEKINPDWNSKAEQLIDTILKDNPYNDMPWPVRLYDGNTDSQQK